MTDVIKNMDKTTLIHMGVELAVVGGISFWLNRKINGLNDKVNEMAEQLGHYEAIIAKQNEIIAKHDAVLSSIMGAPRTTQPQVEQPRRREITRQEMTPSVVSKQVQFKEDIIINEEQAGEPVDSIIAEELAELSEVQDEQGTKKK